jgi:plastocyanin
MKRPLVTPLALFIACGVASTDPGRAEASGTGGVTGEVSIVATPSRRLATAGAYPARGVSPTPETTGSSLDEVIVFVKSARAGAVEPRRVSIRQRHEQFLPRVVAVPAGSTVEFPNEDFIFHNVFSLSRAATFDLGRYPRGESRARTFTEPGIVKVFCQLHAHMSAIVRVFDHPFFARPDARGRFTIDGLQPGTHEIAAWHERVGEVAHRLTVVEGRRTSLVLSLPMTDGR